MNNTPEDLINTGESNSSTNERVNDQPTEVSGDGE
jgi:hypothetical protein